MEPPEKTKTSPTTLKDGDVILSNPQDICDSFNEFFAQIGNTIADYLPDFRNETSDVLEYLHINVNSTFDIPEVSTNFVKEELSKLNDAKSVGLDGISPKLLRLGATAIAPSITWILNLSITTCTFADVWKVAKVVPIHKQGSVQDRKIFRPISILSTSSKLLERHVHISFYIFLNQTSCCIKLNLVSEISSPVKQLLPVWLKSGLNQ